MLNRSNINTQINTQKVFKIADKISSLLKIKSTSKTIVE